MDDSRCSGRPLVPSKWMLILFALTGCSALGPSTVLVGEGANAVQSNFEHSKKIDFSTVDYRFSGGAVSKSIDLLDLQLKIQDGSAGSGIALIGIQTCYGPRVRDGMPIIQCRTLDNETIIVTGTAEVRSELLHLEETGKAGYAIAGILGEHGGSILFLVV